MIQRLNFLLLAIVLYNENTGVDMKQYRLIKFETRNYNFITPCPYDEDTEFRMAPRVYSIGCRDGCPHYRGTSGQRVKCSFGIDDK